MKVLLINEECGTGSTGRICAELAVALEKDGNTVRIAYGRNADNVPYQYQKYAVRIGTELDLKMHGVITRMFDATGFGSIKATRSFVRWVKEFDPDVIHLHNLHGYYINIEILFNYIKKFNKPVIWTLHDVWPFTGHSAYCDAVGCEKWIKGCGNCPQMRVYPKAYIDRSKVNWEKKKEIFCGVNQMTIVTPSDWLATQVKKSFLQAYPITVIHNGIDITRFHRVAPLDGKAWGAEGKKILLSVATVWNNLKGFDDFIQLAGFLDERYCIILVGNMTEKQRKKLPTGIINIPKTSSIEEMVQLYSTADLYVNLTYCDTYPTVNLEATACGIPVVTYAVGGSVESAEKYGGVAVKRGDIKMIAKLIVQMTQNEERRRRAILNRDELDKQYAIQKYKDLLYRSAL